MILILLKKNLGGVFTLKDLNNLVARVAAVK
jgi:hypothetical protein